MQILSIEIIHILICSSIYILLHVINSSAYTIDIYIANRIYYSYELSCIYPL